MNPEYLGDGVYVQVVEQTGSVALTTSSHLCEEADNVIYLEPDVMVKLQDYLARYKAETNRTS